MARKKVMKRIKKVTEKETKKEIRKEIKKPIKKGIINKPKRNLNKKIIIIIVLLLLILLIFLGIYLYKSFSISGRAVSISGKVISDSETSESSDTGKCISDSQCPEGLKCLACERINPAIVASYPVSKDRPGVCLKSCV